MAKPYLAHLKSSKDLKTTYEAIRTGFVALALEKNRRATPFVAQARALKSAASRASPDNSWISMNTLKNRTDQGGPELSAEVDIYRVLKLLSHGK